jgi:hypothetical protein
MQFYPHRTVREQANRLPYELREAYRNSQIDRIEIDGCEIQGYFEYSFMEEKSYVEQPVRAIDGSISNLDDYSTFLTPRLIIKYNMMGIDDYRKLMTLLKSKNSFEVTCYDVVADRRVKHEMYFANPEMPIIYQRYLAALGIRDYSIELIGTNRRKDKTNISFSIGKNALTDAYADETWMYYILRVKGEYGIFYSKTIGEFIVSNDSGISAVCYGGGSIVSPYDKLVSGGTYVLKNIVDL